MMGVISREAGNGDGMMAISTIDIEYNKRLDRQQPCLEDDLTAGSNNIVQSNKNQFDAGDKLYL